MSDYLKLGRDMLYGYSIWVWHNDGDTSYATHRHDYFEIIYYKNCHGICVLNGEEFSLEDDSVFFMTPEDYHRIEAYDAAESESVVVSFAESAIDSEMLRREAISPRVLHHAGDFLKSCLERMADIFVTQKKRQDPENKYLLNEILYQVLQTGQPLSRRAVCNHPLIAKAVMHILTDISALTDLQTVSQKMGISQCYFSELFHKEMGMTFTKWLNRVRVDRAMHLLEETEDSVLEIAMDCGYNNVSHFIRTFRALNACTPSEYRKKKRLSH